MEADPRVRDQAQAGDSDAVGTKADGILVVREAGEKALEGVPGRVGIKAPGKVGEIVPVEKTDRQRIYKFS